jgi:hypothetical protein
MYRKKYFSAAVWALLLIAAKFGKLNAQTRPDNAARPLTASNRAEKDASLGVEQIDFSYLVEVRASKAVNDYVDTVQSRVDRLSGKKGRPGYMAALKKEFGVPAPTKNGGRNAHCVWGQHHSWKAAADALGLDVSPMPETDACETLIRVMRRSNPEDTFYGTIWQSSEYLAAAREKFARAKVAAWRNSFKRVPGADEIAQKRRAFEAEFDRKNMLFDSISPGDIYSTASHTEMYLGEGMLIGFNNETVRELKFKDGRIVGIFIAHTKMILAGKLIERVDRIRLMRRGELIVEIAASGGREDQILLDSVYCLSDDELRLILLEKLFGMRLRPGLYSLPQIIRRQRQNTIGG